MVTISCPNCHQAYSVNDDVVGAKVECSMCNATFVAKTSGVSLKPIAASAKSATVRTPLTQRWLLLFSAIGAIIVLQLAILTVLFTRRSGTPSELLMKYTEYGELTYVKEVLRQNPSLDVNRPRAAGNKTALYVACENGYADIVKLLLEKKADTTLCDGATSLETKYSPMTIAAKNGHLDVVKMLLSAGVDIEFKDGGNRTALYAAVRGNKPGLVRFLCDVGANPNADCGGHTPMKLARESKYYEIEKVMSERNGLDSKPKTDVRYGPLPKFDGLREPGWYVKNYKDIKARQMAQEGQPPPDGAAKSNPDSTPAPAANVPQETRAEELAEDIRQLRRMLDAERSAQTPAATPAPVATPIQPTHKP